jgi:hypothetical protein
MTDRCPSTLQLVAFMALEAGALFRAYTWIAVRPDYALRLALAALLGFLVVALLHVLPRPEPPARVTSRGASIESRAHVAFLGVFGICLHEAGLALPGCACEVFR